MSKEMIRPMTLNAVAEGVSHRKPWTAAQEAKISTAVFLAGIVLNGVVGFMSGDIFSAIARGICLACGAALWIALIGIFFKILRSRAPHGNWRRFGAVLLSAPIVALVLSALFGDPIDAVQRSPLYLILGIGLALTILFVPLAILMGIIPIWLVRRGKYDLALRLNRLFFWTPGNNSSTEGWILTMAGRYAEAREYLQPLAFNEKGHPRLTSVDLFLYTLVLSIEGEESTAEMLYEAAIHVPQKTGDFHFGLADCLLTQKKDPDRARKLVESVLAGIPVNPRSIQQRANRAQMIAFHAWALASNGWRTEAELRLQQATANSSGIGKCNLAALQLPVGDTWLTLGETENARASFRRAVSLFPFGDIAMRAQKKLAEIDRK
jgi:tetratricopeptide (TPR) repeat protein